ncbi:HpcH/HpaI aldolase family protein [Salinivibrio kushneri]|uniref:Aldolase/citrate lyase family protein n=1 Tax=Salinivibrio kushneri TaxID=1908198 RepID=A0AA47KPB3_9GAMM|nr:aldolase/citrate lyase family protein [Salinivibrio kushneri]WBA10507.1 aldolase/citrate lyase family protein [Salinivibrio kushneri]
MRRNRLLERFSAKETMVNSWISIPSSYCAEVIAHTGVDSVTVDMQHGMIGFSDLVHIFQAVSTSDAMPLVRVPSCESSTVMKVLDAGAYGIICPSVDTPEICRELVSACRYPPIGTRSFGPTRGLTYGGADYIHHADDEIMILAMIESQQSIDNLNEILDTPGLTGIYIGPNDLAYSLGDKPGSDSERVEQAILHILQQAKCRGLFTGIFCSGLENAQKRKRQGFDLVTPGNDAGALRSAYQNFVANISNTSNNKSSGVGGY